MPALPSIEPVIEPPRARAVVEAIYPVPMEVPMEAPAPKPAPAETAPPAGDAARHDQTDIVPARRWSPVGLRPTLAPRRALGWGWWVALALAVAFFVACVLLSF